MTTAAFQEQPQALHMGLPMPNGKLAMWLFLVTEIMFFTAMIGTYVILRQSVPKDPIGVVRWPHPHEVHLIEALGAINTFVLILSSFTVVLAHYKAGHNQFKEATGLIGITLALGLVFLGIKAYEYNAKFEHEILPGRIYEKLDGPTGARYVVQQLPDPLDDPNEVVEAILAGVTPRTRVLFLSHITSPTAAILPLAPLIARARAAGIWTVIDGAHAPGQIPVELHKLGVDFYGGNCHKWLSAPKGSGFLYARREVQDLLEPLVVSWGYQPRDPGPSRFIDEQERQGTCDIAAYLAVPAAIAFQAEHDWPRVRQECHALAQWARARIGDLTDLPHVTADSPDWYGQMVTLPLPPGDVGELKRRLYDEYGIEIPIGPWRDRRRLRISVQGYNTRADVERLVAALEVLLSPDATRA